MKNKLVNRTRPGDAIDNELLARITYVARSTGVPRSRLTDRAIELLLKEYPELMKQYEEENKK